MKILAISYEYPPIGSGLSSVLDDLLPRLAASGDSLDLLTMHAAGLPRDEELRGVRIHRIPCFKADLRAHRTSEVMAFMVRGMLAPGFRGEYDLIFSHGVIPSGYIGHHLARSRGIPHVTCSYGTDIPHHNPDKNRNLYRLIEPSWRHVAHSAHAVIVSGENLGAAVRRVAPNARIHTIHYGLDIPAPPAEARDRTLVLAGRLIPIKNFRWFLESVRFLRLADTVDRIVIIGDGPERAELGELAKRVDVPVEFTGHVDRQVSLNHIRRAMLFVHPSLVEGFPVVLMEAMAGATPTLASDIPGCRSVLGEHGVYFAPGDTDDLVGKLKFLLTHPDERLEQGTRLHRRAANCFDFAVVVRQYGELFREITTQHGGRR
jgi:glycosyltransferase involved in cell wall biosynthesis